MRRIAIALLTSSLLCACGQKGNLYLPDAQGEAVSAPASSPAPAATTDDEQAARSNRTN
jgi:predicted small lipoprotein YifL